MDPVAWIVVAGVATGCLYSLIPGWVPFLRNYPGSLFWILGIGLVARFAFMLPDPILEIDFYRYLWDGAVANAGHSPYSWSPDQVLSGEAPRELQHLFMSSPGIVEKINYPHLTTIYPPMAQAVFAVSSWIEPWDIMVWRWVLFVFDSTTLVLLYAVLRHLNRSPVWLIIYWWNPIVIFEFSNAVHMDAILLPFLVGAYYFALRSRTALLSTICLAIGVATKLWPALLLPTFIRSVSSHRSATILAAVFIVLTTILLSPFLTQAFYPEAGFHAYSVSWQSNAALFHTFLNSLRYGMDYLGWFDLNADLILRLIVGVTISLIALAINRHAAADGEAMARRIIIVIAALLLLGPTLYPWYYTWMVPFLVIVPSRALLAFSAVLPLYLLKSHPWIQSHPWVYSDIIAWFEQGPILIMLLFEWRNARKIKRSGPNFKT